MRIALFIATSLMLSAMAVQAKVPAEYFDKSYAVVVGIRDYQDARRWPQLKNNENDAGEITRLLRERGFSVKLFIGPAATKRTIESYIEDTLAPRLRRNDRVVFYFSGHGETQQKGGEDWGYVIPYDATEKSSSWISMERLQTLARMMGAARHQLFIFDACFGGTFGLKSSLSAIPESVPDYIGEVTKVRARQYLTAGGAKERSPAESRLPGYKRFSFFTAHLVKALREDAGDLNKDGVITASELDAYLGPSARSKYNTPRGGSFAGHEQGNFVLQASRTPPSPIPPVASGDILKGGPEAPVARDSNSRRLPFEPKMVWIPGGSFIVGLRGEKSGDEEQFQRRIQISAFEIGKYEVTWKEWEACVAEGGCAVGTFKKKLDVEGWNTGNYPVVEISWNEAQAYVRWLSAKTSKEYRLPSEAEWEYAARAGSTTDYPWGNDIGKGNANCNGCGSDWDDKQTAPVGSFKPNDFGLYDMHGNAAEWVQDCWDLSHENTPVDGSARGGNRSLCPFGVTVRNGGWFSKPYRLHSGARSRASKTMQNFAIGFRVARTLPGR